MYLDLGARKCIASEGGENCMDRSMQSNSTASKPLGRQGSSPGCRPQAAQAQPRSYHRGLDLVAHWILHPLADRAAESGSDLHRDACQRLQVRSRLHWPAEWLRAELTNARHGVDYAARRS